MLCDLWSFSQLALGAVLLSKGRPTFLTVDLPQGNQPINESHHHLILARVHQFISSPSLLGSEFKNTLCCCCPLRVCGVGQTRLRYLRERSPGIKCLQDCSVRKLCCEVQCEEERELGEGLLCIFWRFAEGASEDQVRLWKWMLVAIWQEEGKTFLSCVSSVDKEDRV